MGKIYGGVENIKKPELNPGDKWEDNCVEVYTALCDKYVEDIKNYARNNNKDPEAGKEISFSVADGSARYVVLSLKPVVLIHLDILDGYCYQYINRLTASDIRKEIKRNEALEELFSKK